MEGLLLCTCAEPCPDDRSGSIQHQDKEVKKKSKVSEENTFKNSVLECSPPETCGDRLERGSTSIFTYFRLVISGLP
jgi:hypothetical protein